MDWLPRSDSPFPAAVVLVHYTCFTGPAAAEGRFDGDADGTTFLAG